MKSTVWETPGVIDALKAMYAQELSHSTIAARLWSDHHIAVSRNAVIGKCSRLGLPPRERVTTPRLAGVGRRTSSKRGFQLPSGHGPGTRAQRIVRRREEEPAQEIDFPELFEIPVEQRKTLMGLDANTCRWPVGHPGSEEFYFCGALPHGEKPYCAHHCRVAYQPLSERTKTLEAAE